MCRVLRAIALKSSEVSAWKESIAAELHVVQNKRRCWEIELYLKGTIITSSGVTCSLQSFKVKMKEGWVDRYMSRLVVDGSRFPAITI